MNVSSLNRRTNNRNQINEIKAQIATMCIQAPLMHLKKGVSKQSSGSIMSSIKPLHLLFFVPFLPSSLFLNRGYTVYYHHITIVYLLTKKEPIRRFLIVQGTGITLGWYSAMMYDYYHSGRVCHLLYMNMPQLMKSAMVDENGYVFYTSHSKLYMCISHILDIMLHPGIVCFLYKAHQKSGGTLSDIVSMRMIIAAFLVARLWSVIHTLINGKEISGYYFGYDVYHLHDLESWLPAYIAEGVFFFTMITYRICFRSRTKVS